MLLKSLEAVFIVFVMIAAGMFVSWRKWLGRDAAKALPKIVINISLPATIVVSLYENFTRKQLLAAWLPLLIIFASAVAAFYLAKLAAHVLHVPVRRRGVFVVAFAFSNSSFIGFPVAQALFGDPGMPYAVFYFLAGHTTFWLMGNYAIERDADMINGRVHCRNFSESLKKLAQPPTLITFAMFAVVLSGLRIPDVILTTAKYIGNLTTPLSLIFIGCMIQNMGRAGLKWDKELTPVLIGRFLLVPALCFGIASLGLALFAPSPTPAHMLMRNVFVVQIGLPALMQTAISAEVYGADTEFATKAVLFSTLLSVLTIPVNMMLLAGA